MSEDTVTSASQAVAHAYALAAGAIRTAVSEGSKHIPDPVKAKSSELYTAGAELTKKAYEKTVGKLQDWYASQSPERQSVIKQASTVAVTLALSHVLRSWYCHRRIRHRGAAGTHAAAASAKDNASNAIYESEASARQYMEFHYTPSKLTYAQRLRTVQESFDFPVRLVNKFRVYTPRTAAFQRTSSRRGSGATRRGSNNGSIKEESNKEAAAAGAKTRALDVGCATGASVFEMSKHFDEVVGIDYSEVFVHLANEVKEKSLKRPKSLSTPTAEQTERNTPLNVADNDAAVAEGNEKQGRRHANGSSKDYAVPYTAPVQGNNTESRELILSPFVYPERCSFYCGDAMDMLARQDSGLAVQAKRSSVYKDVYFWKAPVLTGEVDGSAMTAAQLNAEADRQSSNEDDEQHKFDAVLCSNLIDRVPDPSKLLASFALLLRKGGVLVLCDPYSWWEGATAKQEWIGGRNGVRSEDEVKRILSERFELLSESEEGFLIRDHIRHYQLGFSHCTIWRRR